MSSSLLTLLTRNLHDVFGENDPVRRRAAIDEIFTEDCVLSPECDVRSTQKGAHIGRRLIGHFLLRNVAGIGVQD